MNCLNRLFLFATFVSFVGQPAAGDSDYEQFVKPVLRARCYSCHGPLKQEAGLRLDTGRSLVRGGDSGAAAVAGEPQSSLIVERVTAQDASTRMPPEGSPLSATEIGHLRDWIAGGALSPDGEEPAGDPRQHWAFRPLRRPALPVNARHANPIDAFLSAAMTRQRVTARPRAPKHVLLRRVYIDLIGLPPTPSQQRAFADEETPDAYERVVSQLLSNPRHGERWARHWMDVWRYSDWYGRRDVDDVRNSAAQIFRWRDWIVSSLNNGKGYDRMVREMLAADEIYPEDYAAGVATGYLVRNYYSLNPNDWMRNSVEHTGRAFLGLSFHCAHCHDHKYDPISQREYFQLRAFFEPIFVRQDRVAGEADPGPFQDYTYAGKRNVQRLGSVRIYDRHLDASTWFYLGGDERNKDRERGAIPADVPAFLKPESFAIESVDLPPTAWYPGLRDEVQSALRNEARQAVAAAEQKLATLPKDNATLRAEYEAASASVDASLAAAEQRGQAAAALAGEQSLVLQAADGRIIVHNQLAELRQLAPGLTIEFQLLIQRDAHFNVQLVKNSKLGHTAGYVGWEGGQINAYTPGTTKPVRVGEYRTDGARPRFSVRLEIEPESDRALLSIRSLPDNRLLVDRVPTALNGWNPVGNELMPISFDARTGTVAAIDDLRVTPPGDDSKQLLFDFEAPVYKLASSPLGTHGWQRSAFSEAAGTVEIGHIWTDDKLRAAKQRQLLAEQRLESHNLQLRASRAAVAAARADQLSLEKRIAAARAAYVDRSPSAEQLARDAHRADQTALIAQFESEVATHEAAKLAAQRQAGNATKRATAVANADKALAAARGKLDKARAEHKQDAGSDYRPLSQQFPKRSTGRRRALANWIASADNPLTARVAVNHIWARHFHAPLVASVDNFGVNGDKPTHPQLLDWLASELISSGWDMKRLHRLIVTSAAYCRTSSTGDGTDNRKIDEENRLLWRMNYARMEAEVIRDSLLAVAGDLDFAMGGVEIENKHALTTHRRTLYYSVHPERGGKSQLGELFDAPNPLDCYRRASTIVPQQALAMTNSELVDRSATSVVDRWLTEREGDGDDAFIADMFVTILSRSPSAAEFAVARQALAQQRELSGDAKPVDASRTAYRSLVRVLLNHNDFVTVR